MDGHYVGRVADEDPLHAMLSRIVVERCGVEHPAGFRAFRLHGSNEVYGYEECVSGTRLIGKFFGRRFGWDRDRAVSKAGREFASYETLRGYQLVGTPHHVVRPLGLERDINCVLVLEYYGGESLCSAIARGLHGDHDHLFGRLTALSYYLATQHNRTADGAAVDFGTDLAYLDRLLDALRVTGRLGAWDADEIGWLAQLWSLRPRMWADRQVWLHGDATPANFLFGAGLDVGAIDLERMRRGDRVFDVGRVAGELQHAFLRATGSREGAEPFIGHFLWEYCCHFPDREAAFASVTARVPFHMATNLLRIARNAYVDPPYAARLVAQAKELLRTP
ncbi:phosphotransferase family protein [Pseudonocardia sp.]|uniref:phosphotransferase family protein n=1 Tax=Pseudonocardia sp. TaxID=60912 RepID=UPI003D0FC7BA